MRVHGIAGAAGVLLVAGAFDDNRVVEGSCALNLSDTRSTRDMRQNGRWARTLPGSVQGPHVEDVNALHLSDELQTLETGGLLDVGRDGAGLRSGGDEVFFAFDFCRRRGISA